MLIVRELVGVRGAVAVPADAWVPKVIVYITRSDDLGTGLVDALLDGRRKLADASDGFAFEWTDLAEGRYWIGVGRIGERRLTTTEIAVVGGMADVGGLALPTVEPRGYAVVVATTETGSPVDDVSIVIVAADAEGQERYRESLPIRVGAGTFMVNCGDDMKPMQQWLEVRHAAYGVRRVAVAAGVMAPVVVRFQDPAVFECALSAGAMRAPVCYVLEMRAKDGTVSSLSAESGVGVLAVGPLQPGVFDVRLLCRWAVGAMAEVAGATIELRGGVARWRVSDPCLHRVSVFGRGRARIVVEMRDGKRAFGLPAIASPEDGSPGVLWLPSGEYRIVMVTGTTRETREVVVGEDVTVQF